MEREFSRLFACGYDGDSRLQSVTDATNSAAYSYLANASLVSQILYQRNGVTSMTTARTYDNPRRVTGVSSALAAGVSPAAVSSAYSYNAANQRTRNAQVDGSQWRYEYDRLGQVVAGRKYWADGTAVAGEPRQGGRGADESRKVCPRSAQFGYSFDDIGNRPQTNVYRKGAGGVGGLLFVGYTQSPIGYCAPAFDGNGNVLALTTMSGGTNVAQYEYGPFGELLRATGPMAKANPFRFSSKYQDDETDLVYYGLRYLKNSTGGWLSRDPIAEKGGINLYAFVNGDPVDKYDSYGLYSLPTGPDDPAPEPGTPDPGGGVWHQKRLLTFTWCATCMCRNRYIDHGKTHTTSEAAYFEEEEQSLIQRFKWACSSENVMLQKRFCRQLWRLYWKYY